MTMNPIKIATLMAVTTFGVLLALPRESRGDIDPKYKCGTYYPSMSSHVTGSDGRTYCCKSTAPTIRPPQNVNECVKAPWDTGTSAPPACASSVTGNIDDTENGDLMGEDADPLEFFLVPSDTCRLCAGTTEATLLAAARVKAATFCQKEAKFSAGPATLVSFEPAGAGRSVCDKWRFRCSCPGR